MEMYAAQEAADRWAEHDRHEKMMHMATYENGFPSLYVMEVVEAERAFCEQFDREHPDLINRVP